MSDLFAEAFATVLSYELDRRMLVALCKAEREVRYEELRRAVDEPSSENFKRAFNRLLHHALVARRLIPQGEANYESHLSPTVRGRHIAKLLTELSRSVMTAHVPTEIAEEASAVLLGQKGARSTPRASEADAPMQ